LPPARRVIDILFVALVIVAASITAVTVAKVVMDSSATAKNAARIESPPESRLKITVSDQDQNASPDLDNNLAITDGSRPAQVFASEAQDAGLLDHPGAKYIYESSPIVLPITWGAVAGTVIWRGKTRSKWSRQGYGYDTFRLVSNMRGSPNRIRLLNAVKDERKNKLQLAKELGVDWKTIDNHAEMLAQARLIEESGIVGTARYYSITENGRRVLSLLAAELEERK
jgi:DNA-binding MarR family transcriptional regulator